MLKKRKSSGTAFNVVKATVPGATPQNVFVGWFSLTNSIQVINFKSISDKFQLPLESNLSKKNEISNIYYFK